MAYEELKRTLDQVKPAPQRAEAMLLAILAGEGQRPKGRKLSRLATVSLAAALCVALAITALAVSPTLRGALQNALGLFQPYSQEVEGVSVVDQGIEIKVVSALSDGSAVTVYYEIKDLTGDRLDEFTRDDVRMSMLREGENGDILWVPLSINGEMVHYDGETRTLLMRDTVRGGEAPTEELILRLNAYAIQPGHHDVRSAADPAWIAQETLKTEVVDNRVVLAPGQNPRPLDSEYFSLSSFGFGEDGVLHFQVKTKVDDGEWASCNVYYSGGTSRSDTPGDSSRSYRYCQAGNGWGDWPTPLTRFQRDGVTYYDCRTGITPADVAEEDVDWFDWFDASLDARPTIWGEWSLEVTVQSVEQFGVDITDPKALFPGIGGKTLNLSPLGCTIEYDFDNRHVMLNGPLAVYLADGRVLSGIEKNSGNQMTGHAISHWSFPEPVEPSEITAIAIGQWYIPIQNGAAQPGHWLNGLP